MGALLVVWFMLMACRAAVQLPPLTLDEVARLIRDRVPPVRIQAGSRERCLGFAWGPEAEARLRAAGATSDVLDVVQTACKRLPPPRFSGSPVPPRPEVGRLRPLTGVYRLRGQSDSITQQILHETRDGHAVVRLLTTLRGDQRGSTSETRIDAVSFAPVSYAATMYQGSATARVILRRVGDSVVGIAQDYGKPTFALQYNAHEGTLLPGMSDLMLLATPDLSLGRRFVLPTFTNTTGDPCLLSLAVERETTVTVPAGIFPAWQVRASGDGCGRAFRLYVSREPIPGYPPRVILATEGSGYRVELIRVRPD
ncbi:hypothetical protein [Longimicrobium terrae]|uniref:DUF3108 domain-containing protein n=1 Tax=Longimicrobium terrae TaxID=1639882 RepID=A0A841GZX4_9BACT|nr:hypothetical protein [Longimicrobium terrae]MBB4637079.1 hypothetical protein [Longimicrobium terrae]MBB6071313.1 hypothetical protein [Longimicrobium terrae]NNC31468.1 hypothetical protein [Longimicrobium terrae]